MSPFDASVAAMEVGAKAFDLYDDGNAVGAIETFKQSGKVSGDSLKDRTLTVEFEQGFQRWPL